MKSLSVSPRAVAWVTCLVGGVLFGVSCSSGGGSSGSESSGPADASVGHADSGVVFPSVDVVQSRGAADASVASGDAGAGGASEADVATAQGDGGVEPGWDGGTGPADGEAGSEGDGGVSGADTAVGEPDAPAPSDLGDAGSGGDVGATGDGGGAQSDAGGAPNPCEGLPDGAACDADDDPCTLDVCSGGECAWSGEMETCQVEQSQHPCWTFACGKKDGCQPSVFLEGASCQDGNPCTVNDTCVSGQIKGCLGTPVDVDDANPCTDDYCDNGTVHHDPIDGAACDANGTPGTCQGGLCVAQGTIGCPDDIDDGNPCTQDSCADGVIEHAPLTGTSCSVGGQVGTCDAGNCVIAPPCPTDIDDGNPCTDDSCTDGVVTHAPLSGPACVTASGQDGTCQSGQCVANAPTSCALPWGGTLMNGQSTVAYEEPSVPCGQSCVSEVRICNAGQLSGSFAYSSCAEESCGNDLPFGKTVYTKPEDVETFTVPAGASKLDAWLWGAGGGGGAPGDGGGGAFVHVQLDVSPGSTLEIRVAGPGAVHSGGGASYLYVDGAVMAVAAGGGGGGCDGCSGCSMGDPLPDAGQGGGGGPAGGSGEPGVGNPHLNVNAGGGQGASASAPGQGGAIDDQSIYSQCAVAGQPGAAHQGGAGGKWQCGWADSADHEQGGKATDCNGTGGGGGAGWYGGGSGAEKYTYAGGGGGGGSSYVAPGVVLLGTEGGTGPVPGGTASTEYAPPAGQGGKGKTDSFGPDATPGFPGRIVLLLQ